MQPPKREWMPKTITVRKTNSGTIRKHENRCQTIVTPAANRGRMRKSLPVTVFCVIVTLIAVLLALTIFQSMRDRGNKAHFCEQSL